MFNTKFVHTATGIFTLFAKPQLQLVTELALFLFYTTGRPPIWNINEIAGNQPDKPYNNCRPSIGVQIIIVFKWKTTSIIVENGRHP